MFARIIFLLLIEFFICAYFQIRIISILTDANLANTFIICQAIPLLISQVLGCSISAVFVSEINDKKICSYDNKLSYVTINSALLSLFSSIFFGSIYVYLSGSLKSNNDLYISVFYVVVFGFVSYVSVISTVMALIIRVTKTLDKISFCNISASIFGIIVLESGFFFFDEKYISCLAIFFRAIFGFFVLRFGAGVSFEQLFFSLRLRDPVIIKSILKYITLTSIGKTQLPFDKILISNFNPSILVSYTICYTVLSYLVSAYERTINYYLSNRCIDISKKINLIKVSSIISIFFSLIIMANTLFFGRGAIGSFLEIYFPSYISYHAYEMILFLCISGLVYIFSSTSSTLLNFLGESIYAAKAYFFSNMLLVFLKLIFIDFIGFFSFASMLILSYSIYLIFTYKKINQIGLR